MYFDNREMLVTKIEFQTMKQILSEIGGIFTVVKLAMIFCFGPWISNLFLKSLMQKFGASKETIMERLSFRNLFRIQDQINELKTIIEE